VKEDTLDIYWNGYCFCFLNTIRQIICSCSFAANTISKFPDNNEEFYRGPHIQYLHQRTKTNPLDVHLLIILCVTFQVFKIKNCTCRPCVLARKKWTYQVRFSTEISSWSGKTWLQWTIFVLIKWNIQNIFSSICSWYTCAIIRNW
jgi:hypothetical protein